MRKMAGSIRFFFLRGSAQSWAVVCKSLNASALDGKTRCDAADSRKLDSLAAKLTNCIVALVETRCDHKRCFVTSYLNCIVSPNVNYSCETTLPIQTEARSHA
uniref:Putative secreted protein n=1 Tax=Amblyomma americanum TaxID=6943 RepID=A0A0C9SEN5_AMBAM